MGKLSRTKGHSYERLIANILKDVFPHARRQLEYHIKDANGVDLQDTEPFKVQCKRGRGYAPINKIEEVQCGDEYIPLLITKADNKESMVVLSLNNFMKILKGGII